MRKAIRDITSKFQAHPLWRMIHIAIACNRIDVFTDEGFEFLRSNGYNIEEYVLPCVVSLDTVTRILLGSSTWRLRRASTH